MENVKECAVDISAFVLQAISLGLDPAQIIEALLTPSEIESLYQRLAILDDLARGVSQREISEKLGVGIATVTRGSRALRSHSEILRGLFPRQPSN